MPVANNCAYIPTYWYFSSAHGPMSFVGRPSSLTVMKYSRRFLATSRVPGSPALQCRASLAEFRAILLHGKALLRRDVDHIRPLKACPERSEGRRLGESASPEGLIASLRTREVAEPALQGTGASADLRAVMAEVSEQVKVLDGVVRYRFGNNAELMGAWASVHSVVGPFWTHTKPQVGGGETPKAA